MTTGGRIQYALLMGACRITGMFPNRLLYHALAPFICFVLHRIVRYRLTVVRTNLSNSFPEKSAAELREIETKFYRHLSEVFVDTIKRATISRKEILERMVYRDVEAQEEAMRGRNWISAMSHYGSWELTINYACHSDHRVLAVYRPLHSEAFDLFYHKARSRFGTQPVPMNNILQETLKSKRKGARPVSVALIADQTPPWHEIKHCYRFLGQDTPFFFGRGKNGVAVENAGLLHVCPQNLAAALRSGTATNLRRRRSGRSARNHRTLHQPARGDDSGNARIVDVVAPAVEA